MKRSSALLAVVWAFFSWGCGSDHDGPIQGEEQGTCYPNGTCNTGLSCYSNLCVRIGDGEDVSPQADVPGGEDLPSTGDLGPLADNNVCQPTCPAGCGGGSDGCGGSCGCTGSEQCVHDHCIPNGFHWLYGEVTVSHIYDNVNNRDMGDLYDALINTQFRFLIAFNVVSIEPVVIPAEPPMYISEEYTTVTYDSAIAFVDGANLGALATLPGDINGSSGIIHLEPGNDAGTNFLTLGIPQVLPQPHQRITLGAFPFSGTQDGSGCPELASFVSTSASGSIANESANGAFIVDLLDWTGTVEYQ